MKLNALGSILLALLLIAAIVFSFLLFGVALGIIDMGVLGMLVQSLSLAPNRLIVAAAGGALLLVSLLLLFCGRVKHEKKAEAAPASALMQQNEIGGTYVSLDAIDAMVQKHCRAQSSVRDCQSTLRSLEDGVSIGIRLSVLPDTDIATLTQQLQSSLREYIQSLTGITVKEIGILVENAAADAPKRVE